MGTIFGIGPLEVLVILTLVLLIFGPERLPELTRNLGTAIRRLKETYVAFVTEFREELTPIATEIDAVTRDLRNDLAAIRDAADIRGLIPSIGEADIGAVQPTPAELPAPLPLEKVPEPATPVSADVSTLQNGTIAPVASSNGIGASVGANAGINGVSATTYTNGKPAVGSNAHYTNGNGRSINYGTPEQVSANPPLSLDGDNPWGSIGAPIRTDQLDEDNPWRQ